MLILGIDTSCDDTSAGIVEDGRRVLANVVSSQVDLHAKYGGVVPEIASRRHLELMVPVIEEALSIAGESLRDLNIVAVTNGPGLLGALLVGVSFAKSLAYGLGVPLIGVHHLEGHIYSNFLGEEQPEFPVLNLVVSGGHSDLILMEGHGKYRLLGETRDDAAGEVFDKVARELGLPYPGGPHLDKLAESGDDGVFQFPHPKISSSRFDFSFSGLKTRALQEFSKAGARARVEDMCACFRAAIVRELLYNVEELIKETGAASFAISGGVAANSLLRQKAWELCNRIDVPIYIPSKELCTDNGAMIAASSYYRSGQISDFPIELNALAGLELINPKKG